MSGRRAFTPGYVLVALTAAGVCACAPPETQRVRGGDPGADIGNRGAVVEMHAGSTIFPDYDCAIRGADCTGPLPTSGRADGAPLPTARPDAAVLQWMAPGGAVRRVIYEPAPDLGLPDQNRVDAGPQR